MVIAGPLRSVAGAIGGGLAAGVGLGESVTRAEALTDTVWLGDELGEGAAGRVPVATAAGLVVVLPEHATTARTREQTRPARARRPVSTLSSSNRLHRSRTR